MTDQFPTLGEDEYRCANCKEVFKKIQSDEDAIEEATKNFPDEVEANQNMAVICDDCFKKMELHFGWNQA